MDGHIEAREYNDNGYLTKTVAKDGSTQEMNYNDRGLLKSITINSHSPHLKKTIITQWHSDFRKPVQQIDNEKITFFEYDNKGLLAKRTTGILNNKQRISSKNFKLLSKSDIKPDQLRESTFRYNKFGSVEEVILPNGLKEERGYDSQGRFVRETNSLGHESEILEYDTAGRVLRYIDDNGIETQNTYDQMGRLLTTSHNGLVTTNQYDKVGNLIRKTFPDGSSVSYKYDASGNILEYIDAEGNVTEKNYDLNGNQISNKIKNSEGKTLVYSRSIFNDKNLMTQRISANGAITHYEYDVMGRQTKVTYPNGTTSSNVYDEVGNLIQVTDALDKVTRYEYDSDNNQTKVIAPNGAITTYLYDAYGQLIKEISPDRGETNYDYNSAGQLVSKKDANKNNQIITYDLLNRKTSETFNDDTDLSNTYEYDTCYVGKLCKMKNGNVVTTFSYNNEGDLINKEQEVQGVKLNISYDYDKYGNTKSITYPSGSKIEYNYDGHHLTSIKFNESEFIKDIEYNAAEQLQSWTWSDNNNYIRDYDSDGRIKSFPLAEEIRTVEYNELDHITSWSDNISKRSESFNYDKTGQLINYQLNDPLENILKSQSFSYDSNGNRLHISDITQLNSSDYFYTIKNSSNQLSKHNEVNYKYDSAGNVINDGKHQYFYNSANQLINVDNEYTYLYNPIGQRVAKSSDKSSTFYIWDNNRIIAEYDKNGKANQETIYLGKIPVGVIRNGNIFRIFSSQENAPRIITDENGMVVWKWLSIPFGEQKPDELFNGERFTYNLRYPGQYHDTETGLNYNYHRYYQPSTGRYLQSDPLGLDGGLNSYMYTGNNPLTRIDMTGLKYTKTITTFNVQINASIAVFGAPTATQGWQLVHAWRNDILTNWHNGGTRRYQGTRLTNLINKSVTFNVRMTYDHNATAHWQAVQNSGMQNAIRVIGPNQGAWINGINGWSGDWESNAGARVPAHEFGHILGLGDHYRDLIPGLQPGDPNRQTVSCPGHQGHLMGAELGPLQQHELDDMIDIRPGGC